MKRRYFTVAILSSSCIALALGVLVSLPPRLGVTKANFDLIQVGMSDAQVTAILGKSHGNMDFDGPWSCGRLRLEWVNDEGDRVWAPWTIEAFFVGTVDRIQGEEALIHFDDGDQGWMRLDHESVREFVGGWSAKKHS